MAITCVLWRGAESPLHPPCIRSGPASPPGAGRAITADAPASAGPARPRVVRGQGLDPEAAAKVMLPPALLPLVLLPLFCCCCCCCGGGGSSCHARTGCLRHLSPRSPTPSRAALQVPAPQPRLTDPQPSSKLSEEQARVVAAWHTLYAGPSEAAQGAALRQAYDPHAAFEDNLFKVRWGGGLLAIGHTRAVGSTRWTRQLRITRAA
jgi:hypothetical protein